MPKRILYSAALVVALNLVITHAGPVSIVPGRILVKARQDALADAAEDACKPFSGNKVDEICALGVHVMQVPEQAWNQALDGLRRNPNIEFAEPDYVIEPDVVANDPNFASQWHLSKIQAPSAWDKTTGSSSIVIAILDTGVESTHPDLAAKLVAGWNFYDNNSNTADVHGHGTAVAGTAAASSNNGLGVAGVAWGCKIMPVRISDPTGLAYDSTIAKALTWAADHGARVANISFRASNSSTVRSAAQYFQSKNGVVAISAGNDALFDSTADNPYVLTVSATDSNDALASFSNTGNNIDLAAPGVGVLTTSTGASYGSWSGTSFSAPTVAGVAALVLSANPALTGVEAYNVLRQSADDLGAAGFDTQYGYGRVNANRAVSTALSMLPTPPPPPPPPAPTPPPTGSTQEAITGRSGGTLRNDYPGSVGFRFVAAANGTVTDLGRWVVAGNIRTHTVQLLDSGLQVLGSVSVNTVGATAGQTAYATLSSPVSLVAGQTYFLMSSETAGGDFWYNYDQSITENTGIISQMMLAYGAGSVSSAGKSYVPVSFKFTSSSSSPAPPPTGSTQEAITARSGGTLRNDYPGSVGFRFVAAANGTVTDLGRWVVAGNSATHSVQLLNSGLQVLGSVSVNTAGATAGQLAYATLSTPVSLVAGQTYFLMSSETAGGDFWYNYDQSITENSSIISQMMLAYGAGSVNSSGKSYVPVSFKFTPSSSSPSPAPPPTGSTQEAITARSGGTLRNDYPGPVGFRFVAAASTTVTELGRWVVAGNSGTHTVQLLNSALQVLGSVSVNTAGATAGQTAYVTLSSPVSLVAGQTYFLMSNETAGGDFWYSFDQSITENSGIISQMMLAFGAGSVSGAGKSYVPVSFKFTSSSSSPAPPPTGSTQEAITARSGGTLRNDYPGPVGFRFVAAANATVTQLGRWVVAGNSATHSVQLLNSGLQVLGSVSVNTAGATAGQTAYVTLSSPVSLTAGQTYFLMSNETAGGDFWYNYDQNITENTAVVSQMMLAYGAGSTSSAGESYVPVSFKFTLP